MTGWRRPREDSAMHTVPFWLSRLEQIMSWWISTVPQWAQPKWFWTCYYWALDRYG